MNVQLPNAVDYVARVVLACSVLSSLLPPHEVFAFAPRFQTVYRVIGTFIGTVGALNLRGLTIKLYPSYQSNQSKDTPKEEK